MWRHAMFVEVHVRKDGFGVFGPWGCALAPNFNPINLPAPPPNYPVTRIAISIGPLC